MSAPLPTDLSPDLQVLLRKVRLKQDPKTIKAALAVLDVLGVAVTAVHPSLRAPERLLLDVPTVGEITISRQPGYRRLPPDWLTVPKRAREWNTPPADLARLVAAGEYLITRASELLGLPHPDHADGRPVRARDYRTDLTIRTCPYCFRDIKASDHTDGLMADHGFQILGRDGNHQGGERRGSCDGVGAQPWERSPDGARPLLDTLEGMSAARVHWWKKLRSGEIRKLIVERHAWDYATSQYVTTSYPVTPDHPEWGQALEGALAHEEARLRHLWGGSFLSIPWLRMAIRTWQPVPDDLPAVGAPFTPPAPEDYDGNPLPTPQET